MFSVTANVMPDGPVGEVASAARLAEHLGFSSIWVLDEGIVTRDVYIALAAVAAATKTLALGTGITNPYTRHPGVTANAIATLDELSEGRAFVGLGAGGGLTLSPLAIPRHRPVLAVEEMVHCLRRLFSGATVDFRGETLELDSAQLSYARRDIEIWMAGRGPRMLEVAGRLADGVHLSYLHKATIPASVARIRTEASSPRISIALPVVMTDDEFEHVRTGLTFRLVDSPAEVRAMLGLTDATVADLRAALAAGGPAAASHLVRDEWIGEFVVMGDEATCRAEITRIMTDNKIEEFQVPVHQVSDHVSTLERYASLLGM